MPVRLTFEGLRELKEALKQLPEEMATEAAGEIDALANAAAAEVREAYPEGPTGNLRKGVVVKDLASGRYGVTKQVRSRAYHAHLYEYGTAQRQYKGKELGVMPGIPTVIPIMIRARRKMITKLVEIVRRAGFEIRGAVD